MAGVWSSQKKEGSPQTIPGIKDNLQERVSTQSVVEKETDNRAGGEVGQHIIYEI